MSQQYVCVDARFYIWDGKTGYTVEFGYAAMTWYIFREHETSNCVFQKQVDPKKPKTPTRDVAMDILEEYLESIKK